jgi:ABC-type antimicrobial peptide transport system permease subunit
VFERALNDANAAFGIRETSTGAELLDARLARPRFLAATLAALSGAAVILSGVGLYGLLAAAVRERRREIAIRMALGATPAEARALMMREAMVIIGVGLATGIVLALAGTRFLSSALYGVTPGDPFAFGAAVLALIAVAGVAAYTPVARAAHVDALGALRAE